MSGFGALPPLPGPPRAPERRCHRLPPRDDHENPSDLLFPSLNPAALATAFFSSRARDLIISFSSGPHLETQLAALRGVKFHLGGHPHGLGVAQSAGIDSALTGPPV